MENPCQETPCLVVAYLTPEEMCVGVGELVREKACETESHLATQKRHGERKRQTETSTETYRHVIICTEHRAARIRLEENE